MSTLKTIAGFEFKNIGEFYETDEPLKAKYNGKITQTTLCIKLIHEKIKQVGESAYLLFSNDDLVYVGEYSYNLEDRWLKKGKYAWHHKDKDILSALKDNKSVTIWLSTNPYVILENGKSINISKSIEQEVLRSHIITWNKRGNINKNESWIENNCIKYTDISADIEHV